MQYATRSAIQRCDNNNTVSCTSPPSDQFVVHGCADSTRDNVRREAKVKLSSILSPPRPPTISATRSNYPSSAADTGFRIPYFSIFAFCGRRTRLPLPQNLQVQTFVPLQIRAFRRT